MKKRKGVAMIVVLGMFIILVAFFWITASLFTANAKSINIEEKRIQAYYNTMSGLEIGMSAVFREKYNPNYEAGSTLESKKYEKNSIILEYFRKHSASKPLPVNLVSGELGVSDNATVKIIISHEVVGTEIWVVVTSDTVTTFPNGETVAYTGKVKILAPKGLKVKWVIQKPTI